MYYPFVLGGPMPPIRGWQPTYANGQAWFLTTNPAVNFSTDIVNPIQRHIENRNWLEAMQQASMQPYMTPYGPSPFYF